MLLLYVYEKINGYNIFKGVFKTYTHAYRLLNYLEKQDRLFKHKSSYAIANSEQAESLNMLLEYPKEI